MPITWRNINNPNFNASNALNIAAGRQIQDSINSIGTIMDDRRERVTDRNTGEAIARLQGLKDIESYGTDASGILGNYNPNFIDAKEFATAQSDRRTDMTAQEKAAYERTVLRNRATEEFNDSQDANDYMRQHRDENRLLDKRRTEAAIGSSQASAESARLRSKLTGQQLKDNDLSKASEATYQSIAPDYLQAVKNSRGDMTVQEAKSLALITANEQKLLPAERDRLLTAVELIYDPTAAETAASKEAEQVREAQTAQKIDPTSYLKITASPYYQRLTADDPTDSDALDVEAFVADLQQSNGNFVAADGKVYYADPKQADLAIRKYVSDNPTQMPWNDTDFDIDEIKENLRKVAVPVTGAAAELMNKEEQTKAQKQAEAAARMFGGVIK